MKRSTFLRRMAALAFVPAVPALAKLVPRAPERRLPGYYHVNYSVKLPWATTAARTQEEYLQRHRARNLKRDIEAILMENLPRGALR